MSSKVPSGSSSTTASAGSALMAAVCGGGAGSGSRSIQPSAVTPATTASHAMTRAEGPSEDVSLVNASAAATASVKAASMANRAGARSASPNPGSSMSHA